MASIPLSKNYLSTSTPIQEHDVECFKNKSCQECFLKVLGKEIGELSPIRKTFPLRRNLFGSFNDSGYSDVSDIHAENEKNKILSRIFRKSKFSRLSDDINIKANSDDNDSGVYSGENSFSSEDHCISDRLASFSTDENCNIIGYEISISYNINKYYCSTVFHDHQNKDTKRDQPFSILDNRIKVISCNQNDIKSENDISNFDLLSELNLRNCSAVLSLILSYLEDEDLRKSSYISKEWKKIVYSDKQANERRKAYIKKKRDIATGSEKENRFHVKPAIERNHKSAFLSIINSPEDDRPLNYLPIIGRFDSFLLELQNLRKYDKLMKCPICNYPSKNESANKYCCSRNLCQHAFCKKCLGPYLDNHSCSLPKLNATVPNITIGSKKSKKNLRRL